jgi:hypothetical protein
MKGYHSLNCRKLVPICTFRYKEKVNAMILGTTHVDESEEMLVGRKHVGPDVLLQLRGIATLQNETIET